MLDQVGAISVRTYTAGGALPVAGATVRITGAEEANRFISRSLVTDNDGATGAVSLPAPSGIFSLAPSPAESPYALYDVEISAPGYFSRRITGVSVFPGITSAQAVNLIPESTTGIDDLPRGNLNVIIPENESLI